MTDPAILLPRMPPGSTLHLHAVPIDDGHTGRPAEVAVFRVPGVPGGCVVWALYDGVWYPNTGEHHALRLLMDTPRAAEPTTPVRVPAAMIAAARDATGLPSGEAVREVLGRALTLGSRVQAAEAENSRLWEALTDVAQVADELKARIEALEERP